MTLQIDVHPGSAELVAAAATTFITEVAALQASGAEPHVVLTGGSTGIGVLRAIAEHPGRDTIDWNGLHLWWGDERFVPAGDNERNDGQADEALLSQVPLDPAKVHRIPASDGPLGDDPDAAARAYADELATHGRSTGPLFDILMLGLGEEGHTASIFPRSPAATAAGATCSVRDCPKPPPTRISMTFETLARADEVWMMTAGAGKAPAVAAALTGADPLDIPAAGPRGVSRTRWMLDEAAAGELPVGLPVNRPGTT